MSGFYIELGHLQLLCWLLTFLVCDPGYLLYGIFSMVYEWHLHTYVKKNVIVIIYLDDTSSTLTTSPKHKAHIKEGTLQAPVRVWPPLMPTSSGQSHFPCLNHLTNPIGQSSLDDTMSSYLTREVCLVLLYSCNWCISAPQLYLWG